MKIDDGSGKGYSAKVDRTGLLETHASTRTDGLFVNEEEGDLYSASVSITPSANGCFAYIKNLDDRDMIFTRISVHCAVGLTDGVGIIMNNTGTPAGGNTLTVTNRNAGSGKVADATALYGQNITGLAGGATLGEYYLHNTGGSNILRWFNGIVIPKNRTITFCAVDGLIALDFVTIFYYAPTH